VVEVAPPIGSAEDARRTTDVAAGYMLASLAALAGAPDLLADLAAPIQG